ncbi:MAG TPA: hypothetical protein VMV81_11205 [Phycisphaerae bacterium]|nr:hypothetical protein [Phycisphaerae bacterium]
MKMYRYSVLLLVTLAFGCIPDKRIVWSPDGKRAAVSTDHGLYIIDRDGRVLSPRLECGMSRCSWFADSKRLAMVYVQKVHDWNGLAPLFDQKQTAEIAAESRKLRERILAYSGNWDQFELDPDKKSTPGHDDAVLLYLLSHDAAGLAEKVGDPWKSVSQIEASLWKLQMFELGDDRLTPGTVLYQGLDEIFQPKVSPKGTIVAMVLPDPNAHSDEPCLAVAATSGGPLRIVASSVAMDFDWKNDGQSMALVRAHGHAKDKDQTLQLGSLTTIQVADETGMLLGQFAASTDRVGLIFNPISGVRWLADGRILFSTAEVSLPATTRDMPQQWTIFVWDPRMPASVTRAIGRDFTEALEPSTPIFELSPDEKSVLLPGVKGHVLRYDFAGGDTTKIQDTDDADGKTRSLATWRGNDEICYVSPVTSKDGTKKPGEVKIWSRGKSNSISDSWPAEMKDGWLTDGKQ